jgi:hypothetical protein
VPFCLACGFHFLSCRPAVVVKRIGETDHRKQSVGETKKVRPPTIADQFTYRRIVRAKTRPAAGNDGWVWVDPHPSTHPLQPITRFPANSPHVARRPDRPRVRSAHGGTQTPRLVSLWYPMGEKKHASVSVRPSARPRPTTPRPTYAVVCTHRGRDAARGR